MRLSEVQDHPVGRVDLTPLRSMFTKNFEHLVEVIRKYHFEVRIIGGAVRDLLRGRPPRDLDLACDALPDELMYVLRSHDFYLDVKGLQHGTVKVIYPQQEEYEITALDFVIEDREGNIQIRFGRDWRQDALRRDFTINSLSLDLDGNLYDYTGGIADLKDQHVRFIGDYQSKIEHDPVLILRFFKMLSSFPNPQFDKSALAYIKTHAELLKEVRAKRILRELENINKGPNSEKVMALMCHLGLKNYLGMVCPSEAISENLEGAAEKAVRIFIQNSSDENRIDEMFFTLHPEYRDRPKRIISTAFNKWLKEYAFEAVQAVYDRIPYEEPVLTIYREITAPPTWRPAPGQNLGIYWSWDEHAAEAHWAETTPGYVNFHITGEVNSSDVDWPTTLALNALPSSEEEKEIRLLPGRDRHVKVIKIERTSELFGRDYTEVKEHQFAHRGAKDDKLWSLIDKNEFLTWLCRNVIHKTQEQAYARKYPEAYRSYLQAYMTARIDRPPHPNYGIQL